ncbi:hypothetical protein NL676_034193 [Syzygium grande]|nr:hypothetical protein NL676_034193 [Syzygium grande]
MAVTDGGDQLLEVAVGEVLGEVALGDLGEELASIGELHDNVNLETGVARTLKRESMKGWRRPQRMEISRLMLDVRMAELEEESFFLWMILSATLCPEWRL